MLEQSAEYKAAIVGDSRRIYLRAVVDISDPDKVFTGVTGSVGAPWSKPAQLYDRVFDQPPRYATFERNRWLLDGSFRVFPDGYQVNEHMGYASAALSGADGSFSAAQYVSLGFSNMSILQAFSLFFSEDPADGFPVDFTVEVRVNGVSFYSKEVTGNTETTIQFDGFTVYTPDEIRVTVSKWSLPSRRMRMVEIVPGIYEDWSAANLEEFSVTQQGQFSCLTLPYGTAVISIENTDRRFEPRKKDGIFQSIEERQGIELYIGVGLENGVEYKPVGIFYQSGSGWTTSQNAATMKWTLVDIIGLVCNRTFLVPDVLPTTLEGWIAAVVAQLGEGFKKRYRVASEYANKPVTAISAAAVTGKSCGDILRWACMATGTWPRADSATGRLTVEPLWNQGNKITLEALSAYPTMKANESIAALLFQLSDGSQTVISGNATSSEKTVTVQNPFIHTSAQAMEAARLILSCYGGNTFEITGRGDPSSEIGDVDTVWLDEANAATARRMMQTFNITRGVLQGCRSKLLQADGSYLYTEYAVIRESGPWTVPDGVTELRIVLGRGGQGGGYGNPGWVEPFYNFQNSVSSGYGEPGQDGQGGEVWYGVISVNPGETIQVNLGAGGAAATTPGIPGEMGGHTTFGAYSSANGTIYPNGYTDIANGLSFARTGVASPLPGTGDGGKGGAGGEPGAGYLYKKEGDIGYRYQETKSPGPGKPGVAGASGFAMVTWNKPDATI